MSNTRQEKQAFSEQMGQCLADRGFVIFCYRFVIVWVIVWNTWLDPEKNTQIKQ